MKKPTWWLRAFFLGLLAFMLFGTLVSLAETGSGLFGLGKYLRGFVRFPLMVREAVTHLSSPEPYAADGIPCPGIEARCGVSGQLPAPLLGASILVTAYDSEAGQLVIDLLGMADGQVRHRWSPPVDDIRKLGSSSGNQGDWTTRDLFTAGHPLPLPGGRLVLRVDHGPLVCLGPGSDIEWVVDGSFHHSLELDAEGRIWASSDQVLAGADSIFSEPGRVEQYILAVDTEGKVVYRSSLDSLLVANGLKGLVYGAGHFEKDALHINDIQPAHDDGVAWRRGDLLLSLRNRSVILLLRPTTGRIVWYRYGGWVNQHDADFIDSCRIGLFSNEWIRFIEEKNGDTRLRSTLPGHNDFYLLDLCADSVSRPYSAAFRDQCVRTEEEGRSEWLGEGLLLVEDTEHGRLMLFDSEGQSPWSYSKCFGKEELSWLFWCRYLDPEESEALVRSFSR